MARIKWRLDEIYVTSSGGDGGGGDPDAPIAQFNSTTYSIGEDYSTDTGRLMRVQAQLDKVWSTNVQVPYTLGGTATYLSDYWLGKSINDNTEQAIPLSGGGYGGLFTFLPGETLVSQWFWIVDDDLVSGDETFTLTMSASITGSDGTVYNLEEAVLSDTNTVSTVTIIEDDADSGLPQVDWQFSAQTTAETDSDYIFSIDLVLSSVGTNPTVEVVVDGASTATVNTGGGSEDASVPVAVPYNFANNTSRPVPITIRGDTTSESSETVVLTLANPVNCVLGSNTTFTLTITDNDDGTHETASVAFSDNIDKVVAEGNQIGIGVTYNGTVGHDPFRLNFVAGGTSAGPSGNPAQSNDYTITPAGGQMFFDTNDLTKFITVQAAPPGDGDEPNEDVQIRLTSLADAGGTAVADGDITLGSPTTKFVTILDGDGGGGGSNPDGDLTNWAGEQLAKERQAFDATDPHFIIAGPNDPDHGFASEAYQVKVAGVLGRPGDGLEHVVDTWYSPGIGTGTIIARCMRLAEYVWRDLYGGTYTDPQDVPIGTELAPIRIEVRSKDWDPTRLHGYRYDNKSGGTGADRINFSGGTGNDDINWHATNSSNIAIRDVVVYSDSIRRGVLECSGMPGWYLNNDVIIDNIRFERMEMTSNGNQKLCGGDIGAGADERTRFHGRLKMYDGMVHGHPWPQNSGWDGGKSSTTPKWTIRSNPVVLDIRHPEPPAPGSNALPWYPLYPSQEHYCYVDQPPGPDTYPAIKNCIELINVKIPARNHPMHPQSTLQSGMWVGPFYSAARTVVQIVNRPEYLRDVATDDYGKASSGTCLFLRCDTSEHGNIFGKDTTAGLKPHGHMGRVYIKDCRAVGGTNPNLPGEMGAVFQLAIDNAGTLTLGPSGSYTLDPDYTDTGNFACDEIVIDGWDIQNKVIDQPYLAINGCRKVKLRKFAFSNLSGNRQQLIVNYAKSGGVVGVNFMEEWDTSELVEQNADGSDGAAYTGLFSAYPGWATTHTKIADYYEQNWLRTEFTNNVSLASADLDNMATSGPAGYTQTNGLVAQQYFGRTGVQGSGFVIDGGQGSPGTWTSAFGQWSPTLPTLALTTPIGSELAYIGEDDADGSVEVRARLGWPDRSFMELRVRGTVTLPAAPEMNNTTVRYTEQIPDVPFPVGSQTWIDLGTGSFSFDWYPVNGRVVNKGQTQAANSPAPVNPESPAIVWTPDSIAFQIRPNATSALSSGTKTILVDFANASNTPYWHYPYGSGSYVPAIFTTGTELEVNVVPAVDYAYDGFRVLALEYDPNDLFDGMVINIPMERRALSAALQDAMKLDAFSKYDVTEQGVSTSDYSVPAQINWSAINDDTTTSEFVALPLTIVNAGAFGDGSSINFVLKYDDDSQHVQQEAASDLYNLVTVAFTAGGGGTPIVEWDEQNVVQDIPELTTDNVFTIRTTEPTTETKTITVQLTDVDAGTIDDYVSTVPALSEPENQCFPIITTGNETTTVTVFTGNVPGDRTFTMQIVDGDGLIVGNKDTLTLTIKDTSGSGRPNAGNTGSRVTEGDSTYLNFSGVNSANITPAWLATWEGTTTGGHTNVYQSGGRWYVDRVHVDTTCRIQADNVTLIDCIVDDGDGTPIGSGQRVLEIRSGVQAAKVHYTELRGSSSHLVVDNGNGSEFFRCHFWQGGSDALWPGTNSLVHECYFERLGLNKSSSNHVDVIQIQGTHSNVTIRGNHFWAPWPFPDGVGDTNYKATNTMIAAYTDGTISGPIEDLIIEDNWLDGSQTVIQFGGDLWQNAPIVRNNRFSVRFQGDHWTGNGGDSDKLLVKDGITGFNPTLTGNKWGDLNHMEMTPDDTNGPSGTDWTSYADQLIGPNDPGGGMNQT